MTEASSPLPEDRPEKTPAAETTPAKQKARFDVSFVIALVALVISLVGTITSIYEARVLREQQSIMAEQKSAAVWPHVQRYNYVNYLEKENAIQFVHLLENKGIGPALLGDVDYRYNGKSVQTYSVDAAINQLYPDLNVSIVQNHQVDHVVLSAGEQIKVFTLMIRPEGSIFELEIDVNQVADQYQSLFCYCSVYDECWRYDGDDRLARKDATCATPEKI